MSEELKACPFCGGFIYSEEYPDSIDLHCTSKNCVLTGKMLWVKNIEKWNTRPLEDALRSRGEELERELEELKDRKVTELFNQSALDEKEIATLRLRVDGLARENTILSVANTIAEEENARLREMVDASTSALERIFEIAIDWKPVPESYCDGGDITMQPWDKSEPIPPTEEVRNE